MEACTCTCESVSFCLYLSTLILEKSNLISEKSTLILEKVNFILGSQL